MNHSLQQLIDRFWSGDLTAEQKQVLLQQLIQEHPEWMQELEAAYRASLKEADSVGPGEAYFQAQLDLLKQVIASSSIPPAEGRIRRLTPTRWWPAAAILIVVAGVGSYFYFSQRSPQPAVVQQTVIPPAIDSIQTIHIANNTQTVTTHLLPDGTELLVEPGSGLSYLSNYGQQVRAIELQEGQAFFKVAKDTAHPFRVTAGGVQVQALGTAFRVQKAGKKRVSVLLTEGSVSVHTGLATASRQDILLTPGQELIVDQQQSLVRLIQPAGTSLPKNVAAHPKKEKGASHNNTLQFDQQPLNEVLHAIERYYKVKIGFEEEAVSGLWFTGSFRRGDSLSTVLTTLCKLNRLAFRYEAGGYIVSKK